MVKGAQKQNFIGGVAVLTGAVVVVKIISALYKIPLNNILDSEGVGHFTVAYNIYGFLLQLSLAGFPLALSKLTSEEYSLGRMNQVRRQFRVASCLFFLLGASASAVMFFAAEPLAALLHDSLAALAVKTLAPAVFFVCMAGCCRGYTQGLGDMRPTALSQIWEAGCKLAVGLGLAWYVLRCLGRGVEEGAAAAIFGVSVGSAASALFLGLWLLRRCAVRRGTDRPDPPGAILHRLLVIGVPITVGSSVMSLLTLIDQTVVLARLQNALGLTEQAAAALYGEYTFGMTLFNLPATFVYPVTVSLLPAVSAALAAGRWERVRRLIAASYRLVALTALPAGVGMSALAVPVLRLLYPAVPETAAAAAYHLQILGVASVFVCLAVLSTAVLQACGRTDLPIWIALIGGSAKIASNYVLCGDPAWGIRGAPVSTLGCYALMTLLGLIAVARVLGKRRPRCVLLLGKGAAASLAMAALSARTWRFCADAGLPTGLGILAAALLGAAVYGALALLLGMVRREDLALLRRRAR